ncbi:hypothetical protein RRG08_010835 [Elysia crispata]|uniref:Uncharacterized protein n=1 Tax=Elysia crispata TaxID=231223 RepID=A0AAE0ZNA4_9GAST|nr:hypothetical protein RRG08_010835 [Elysia crispata]
MSNPSVDLISGTTYQAEYLVLDVICRGHVAVSLHKFEIRNVASGKSNIFALNLHAQVWAEARADLKDPHQPTRGTLILNQPNRKPKKKIPEGTSLCRELLPFVYHVD